MYRLLFFYLLFVFPQIGFCQLDKNYIPLPFTDTIPANIEKDLKATLEKYKTSNSSSNLSKEAFKYKNSLYEDRTKFVINQFNKDKFMIDSVFTAYLEKISDNIYAANPQLKKETRIYAYRSTVPNAVSYGEGTLAINLGLIERMENESQVAFIICHELAHYHLKHAELKINKLTEINFDPKLKKELDLVRNSEYGKFSKVQELMKDLTFDVTKHSRTKESEADSVGLSYLLKTVYNPFESIRTMEILDSCDLPQYKKDLDLKKNFNFSEYPFKDSWTTLENIDFIYSKEENADSDTADTHPDCKKRMACLRKSLKNYPEKSSLKKDPYSPYSRLMAKSSFELVETLYHSNHLGDALYHTIILLEAYPNNIYLKAMVGKCLFGIHQSLIRKDFGKVVELPDNRYSKNYNLFLNFLHNLRITEISKLATCYIEANKKLYSNDEEYLYALILSSKLPTTSLNKAELINTYKTSFNQGKYISKLKTL